MEFGNIYVFEIGFENGFENEIPGGYYTQIRGAKSV